MRISLRKQMFIALVLFGLGANGKSVVLNTVAGRLGHAEGSTTLRFYAQFTRPPTSAPPWSSPLSSTATARRNACASCTVSISRPLGADSLAALASDAGPFRELEIFFNRTGLGASQPFLTRALPEWSVDGYRHLPRYVNGHKYVPKPVRDVPS